MKFGVVGSTGTAAQAVDLAVTAEESGWDGYFTWDGISVGPLDTWDPWAVLAAAAVRTERITLGAMVFALPRRRPWVVARQALTVDHLSGGRLVLPVGIGAVDDAAFRGVVGEATTARERAERLDDALAVLDLAATGETFSYRGHHLEVSDMTILPRPVQRPRVPVWVVGAFPSERSMGRAARWDGVVVQLRGDRAMDTPTPDDVAQICAWVAEHRERREGAGPFEVVVQGVLPDAPADASALCRELSDAGATWWVESRWDHGDLGPREAFDALEARTRQGPPLQ
ncbi:LLM class flavin-dependent oxidoreductase [Paraoerskovia sediminicola]|nr:LLM class flavin-dependent oxidoreductase [Paraoerskovia sediminicola]